MVQKIRAPLNLWTISTAKVKAIPDAVTSSKVVEIKDVKTLSNTRQIQAQANYAKKTGREYVVYVGSDTHVTPSASKTISNAGGKIVRLNYLGLGD